LQLDTMVSDTKKNVLKATTAAGKPQ